MSHALTEQQHQAVLQALSSPVSVLCGGAGTGKTSALRALLEAAKRCFGADYPIHQVALSGRASKRMTESTGAEATTVYRFLLDVRLGRRAVESGLLVVDEASMLDLPSVYNLMRSIGANVRVLFVGDPAQLPPIGPGLVFHRLVLSARIPRVELRSIQRQKEETGIPHAGAAIREGRWPQLRNFDWATPQQRGAFFHEARACSLRAGATAARGRALTSDRRSVVAVIHCETSCARRSHKRRELPRRCLPRRYALRTRSFVSYGCSLSFSSREPTTTARLRWRVGDAVQAPALRWIGS